MCPGMNGKAVTQCMVPDTPPDSCLPRAVFMHLSSHKPSVCGRGYKQTAALYGELQVSCGKERALI